MSPGVETVPAGTVTFAAEVTAGVDVSTVKMSPELPSFRTRNASVLVESTSAGMSERVTGMDVSM